MKRKKQPRNLAEQYSLVKADYELSKNSRFVRQRTGLAANGGSGDYHYRTERDYYKDMEKVRDADRNDAILGQTIDRAVDNVIQDGFTFNPNSGDKKVDQELRERMRAFCDDAEACDIAGEMTWHDYERAAFRSHLVDGDSFVWVTNDGPMQFIEGHQIQTRTRVDNTFCGITMDDRRKRLLVHYLADPIEPMLSGRSSDSIPIEIRDADGHRQICQIYNNRRALMTRGVSAIAPIFYIASMFEDVNFAKVVQQQIVSCFAIFREMAPGQPNSPPSTNGYGERVESGTEPGARFIDGVSPGLEIIGKSGEKLHGFSPNVPNAEYFDHVKLLLTIIGVNLGLPLCLVLMDGSETNFSGWRGAVDEARKGFRQNQRMVVKRFHNPATIQKIRHFMEDDRALKRAFESGVKLFNFEWQVPEWKYINPKEDAEADAAQLRNCLTSPRRLMVSRGNDWETIATETVQDNVFAIQTAMEAVKKLNAINPTATPLTWRDVLPLVLPQNANLSLQDPAVVNTQAEAVTAASGEESPTGEMAEASTLQFNRNRKAINKILTELQNGEVTERRARIDLGLIGLATKTIDALIADALDGSGQIESTAEGNDNDDGA